MHELGIAYHVVRTVEAAARKNGVTRVEAVVLQVGSMSGVVPKYIRACFPAAADGTMLEHSRLELELTEGGEFIVKEIVVREPG